MSNITRFLVATAAAVAAVATLGTVNATAQELLVIDDGNSMVIDTKCGEGTLELCGVRNDTKCELEIELEINILTRGGKFGLKQTNCQVINSTPVYKNIVRNHSYTPTVNTPTPKPPAPKSCSSYERGKGIC